MTAHRTGVDRTVWPGFTGQYWQRTRTPDCTEYELLQAKENVSI
ncbi:hypothetical protein [Rhodococcus sp. AW25M09]|nr:hypothetical protein [Rhodococcus sp. AW25M09]